MRRRENRGIKGAENEEGQAGCDAKMPHAVATNHFNLHRDSLRICLHSSCRERW